MQNFYLNQDEALELIKKLSHQDLLNMGIDQVAYIKNIKGQYIVYGADGAQLSIMDSYDMALTAIQISELFPVTLH